MAYDPIKENLTWLSEDKVETFVNREADLLDKYPHAKQQANLVGNLFILVSFLCLVFIVFTFFSKVGII